MSEKTVAEKWAIILLMHWVVGVLCLMTGLMANSWKLIATGVAFWVLMGLLFIGCSMDDDCQNK